MSLCQVWATATRNLEFLADYVVSLLFSKQVSHVNVINNIWEERLQNKTGACWVMKNTKYIICGPSFNRSQRDVRVFTGYSCSPSSKSTHVSIGVCSTGKTSDVSFKLILIMISLYCQHWRWSSNCKVFEYTDFSKRTPNFLHFLMLFSITWDDEFLSVSHLGLLDSWESTPPLLPKGSPEKITLSLCLVQFWWFV